jgi:hypothetical protein
MLFHVASKVLASMSCGTHVIDEQSVLPQQATAVLSSAPVLAFATAHAVLISVTTPAAVVAAIKAGIVSVVQPVLFHVSTKSCVFIACVMHSLSGVQTPALSYPWQ